MALVWLWGRIGVALVEPWGGFKVALGLFRFTIIWESMIVIMREKRAEVIEIIWERVKPRAA